MQIFCSKAYIQFYSFIILSFSSFSLFAQDNSSFANSPYSRFGVGDLMSQENIQNAGMGGVSNANTSFGQINYLNPASYAGIGITTLQAGFLAERNRITTKDSFNTTGGLNVSFLSLGLPIGKKGGASAGIMPETRVSYRSFGTENNYWGNDTVQLQRAFAGGGGIQKFYVGYGHQFNHFQFGINANFLFGNYDNFSKNQFYDTLNIYSSEFHTYNNVRGINFSFGGIYQSVIKGSSKLAGKKINVGVTFQPQSSLNVSSDYYKKTYLDNVTGEDTIEQIIDQKSKLILPTKLGIGLMLAEGDIWKIGMDYNLATWSNYVFNGTKDSTTDIWNFKIGGSYRQSLMDNASFLRKMEYRAGLFTGKDYIRLNSTDINTTGVTLGLGLPLKIRSLSYGMINFALNTGIRGTINNGLVREGFTRFTFGISLSEKWFRKQRYD